MSSSSKPPSRFSPNVLHNILMFSGTTVEDMTWLWTTCREVSREFKDAAERVFVSRHLKRISLFIDAGMTYDKKIGKISLQTDFTFSHIDLTDRTRAVFRETECHDDVKPVLSRALASMFEYGNPVHRPRIVIQIRHAANDTYIPDLEPNWPALEIKCNWKGMVSEWFKEEREHARRVKEALDGTADRMKVLRAKADRGEVTEGASFFSVFQSFFGDYDDTWQMLRAERIARNMHKQWEDEGFTSALRWTDPDRAGYKRLKDARSALGWDDPCSDEEEA